MVAARWYLATPIPKKKKQNVTGFATGSWVGGAAKDQNHKMTTSTTLRQNLPNSDQSGLFCSRYKQVTIPTTSQRFPQDVSDSTIKIGIPIWLPSSTQQSSCARRGYKGAAFYDFPNKKFLPLLFFFSSFFPRCVSNEK